MPVPIRPLSDAEFDAILDSQGHDPCPGVTLRSHIEIRSATDGLPRQIVVIYSPAKRSADPSPALLAFHGGGFSGGDPHGVGAIAKTLALTLGVVTVSVSYRLGSTDNPTGPGIIDDASHAWLWLHAHAAEIGLNPSRVAVAGESAGCLLAGHLAVRSPLVATAMESTKLPTPVAFYCMWGPLDFVARWYDNGENPGAEVNILGPGGYPVRPSAYHWLSVLTHARRPTLPPALFVYGRNDPIVHARQGALGAAAWTECGSHAETVILPHIGHGVTEDNRAQRRQLLEKAVAFASWRHL